MAQDEDRPTPGLYTGGGALTPPEPRNWKPFAYAGAAVLLVLALLLLLGRRNQEASNPGGANPGGAVLASPAPYAARLPLSQIQMSESTNLSGGKETYLDGIVTNTGKQTVRAVTVQVGFRDLTGQLAAKETLPLNLIHFREPYVDTQPVRAAPIRPGEARGFRLIFDAVPASWDGAYPEVRIIAADAR